MRPLHFWLSLLGIVVVIALGAVGVQYLMGPDKTLSERAATSSEKAGLSERTATSSEKAK
jgi:hypothetical protein